MLCHIPEDFDLQQYSYQNLQMLFNWPHEQRLGLSSASRTRQLWMWNKLQAQKYEGIFLWACCPSYTEARQQSNSSSKQTNRLYKNKIQKPIKSRSWAATTDIAVSALRKRPVNPQLTRDTVYNAYGDK